MSYRGSVCLILFRKPGFGLDEAFHTLSTCPDVCVMQNADELARLAVQTAGGSVLTISIQSGAPTQRWVGRLGQRTRHAEALNHCDWCIIIHIDDLRAITKDMATLTVMQKILAEATQGFQYTLWDDKLRSVAELPG